MPKMKVMSWVVLSPWAAIAIGCGTNETDSSTLEGWGGSNSNVTETPEATETSPQEQTKQVASSGAETEEAPAPTPENERLESGNVDAFVDVLPTERAGGGKAASGKMSDEPSTANFDVGGGKRPSSTLTWQVENASNPAFSSSVTLNQARTAAAAAFQTWAQQTTLTFIEITSGTPDIRIRFAPIPGGPADAGHTDPPAFGGSILLEDRYPWTISTSPPPTAFDLESVLLHEIGHSIGLGHSSIEGSVMSPNNNNQGRTQRALTVDDMVGISTLYDTWQQLPGCAKDLAVGNNGSAWAITCAQTNGAIFRWSSSSHNWIQDSNPTAGGVRVAVGPSGWPWVVNHLGNIFRKTNDSTSSGTWQQLSGCAKDIGVGANGSAWMIGCSALPTDGPILRWNGSAWIQDSNPTAGGVRIAVGSDGRPWVVNRLGGIYVKDTDSASSGTWVPLPGLANDIGVTGDRYAWVTEWSSSGADMPVYAWYQQDDATGGNPPPVFHAQWLQVPGLARQIAVGPNGTPWVVQTSGAIFRPFR